jgi:endonuclease/exonuclease/phosphatase family metal-dependent hydrolase
MRTIRFFPVVFLAIACGASAPEDEAPVASPASGEESVVAPPGASKSTPAPGDDAKAGEQTPAPGPAKPADLAFKVLTYNVAGLPEGISKSDPATNSPLISPKLNPYDLVVVQEDFSYHAELVSAATHPNQSTPMKGGVDLGDGLNTLSRFPFATFTRTKWTKCNGYVDSANDCLTPKGFTRFVVDLGSGRSVDFYDVHFDAGRGDGDYAARDKQVDQLVAMIASQSNGKAVIVAGDTNMKVGDEPVFLKLLKNAGLSCACRTLSCPEPERIDRVLFRSSTSVVLAPQKYVVETWLDSQGEPLSDHEPVSVEFLAKSP